MRKQTFNATIVLYNTHLTDLCLGHHPQHRIVSSLVPSLNKGRRLGDWVQVEPHVKANTDSTAYRLKKSSGDALQLVNIIISLEMALKQIHNTKDHVPQGHIQQKDLWMCV